MKLLFGLVLLASGILTLLYHFSSGAREMMRYAWAQPPERALIDTYQIGRESFRAEWRGQPMGWAAWGDEPLVSTRQIEGDIWAASGRVNFVALGTPVRQPWACVFNRKTRAVFEFAVANDDTIDIMMHGDVKKLAAILGQPK